MRKFLRKLWVLLPWRAFMVFWIVIGGFSLLGLIGDPDPFWSVGILLSIVFGTYCYLEDLARR